MEPFGLEMKIAQLRKVPILRQCTRRELIAVARHAEVIQVPAAQTVVRAGEPGAEFFMILDGTAKVEVSARRRLQLGPGDFFGEMSLLDGEPRSATVVAETALRLLLVRRRDFWTLLTEVPDLAKRILMTLSRRVRLAERSVLD